MMSKSQNLSAVLVVEDEVLIRMDVVDTIEDAGHLTYEAGSADAAIQLMEQHGDISILFTDVDMPGSMNGLKLAAYVKDKWPMVALIIASGNVGIDAADMPEGAIFLAKPYSANLINQTLLDLNK